MEWSKSFGKRCSSPTDQPIREAEIFAGRQHTYKRYLEAFCVAEDLDVLWFCAADLVQVYP